MESIKELTALETFPVRHAVLRTGKPLKSCHFDGDGLVTTKHFGLFSNKNLAGIVTVLKNRSSAFEQQNQFQLRGMAVLEDYRKKGFGEQLLQFAETYLQSKAAAVIWFNARIAAVPFYQKAGYVTMGDSFDIADVGEHFLMYKEMKS